MINPTFKQRRLPHYYPEGADYFISYRLAGSIPKNVIAAVLEELQNETNPQNIKKLKFAKIESFLDSSANGPYWLQEDSIAKIVVDSLKFFDGKKILLDSCCVMPNHVHVLFTHLAYTAPVYSIMKDHKGYTARMSNKLLGRSGPFWEQESYDHVVRNMQQFYRVREYILSNPVNAGFVTDWQQWKWSYLSPDRA